MDKYDACRHSITTYMQILTCNFANPSFGDDLKKKLGIKHIGSLSFLWKDQ